MPAATFFPLDIAAVNAPFLLSDPSVIYFCLELTICYLLPVVPSFIQLFKTLFSDYTWLCIINECRFVLTIKFFYEKYFYTAACCCKRFSHDLVNNRIFIAQT
jgi:hypothetical protein